jgi:hypothetical protein
MLDPGTYEVTADRAGFAPTKFEGLTLNVGTTVTMDLVLRIESTITSVEVGATLINLALPAPSTTVPSAAITNLPINGRRFQDFATLTPTVQVDQSRGQLSFAGQRGINANVMLDGADYNQPFFGGIRGGERSNSIITVPQTAIQEFQVVTTGYSAEYGRSTGGVLNTITKSGTNDIHGEAFYQLRHKEMGAKDPVQLIASLETLHQFGGAVGGPIARDKWFLFGAIERQDSETPRQVQFPSLLTATAAQQAAGPEAFNFFKSLEVPFDQTNDASAFTVRSDYQTQAGHQLTLRYNFSDAEAINAVSVGNSVSPFTNRALSNDGIEGDRTHTGTLQYTHLFSPSVLNTLRFTGTFEERPRLSNSALPQVAVTTIGTFGARNFLPTTQDDTRIQIADALSWTYGTHTVKLGFDYSKVDAAQVFGFNQFGAFASSSSNIGELLDILSVGGTIANRFDHNTVTYDRQIGNLQAGMGLYQAAVFAQDSWRVNNKLTLDFGFRWEGQYNPEPEVNNNAVLNQIQGFSFPNGAALNPTQIRDNTAQFMPRFGFAWTPFTGERRTVVRGHVGIFYASTPLLTMAGPINNLRLPPGDVSIRLSNSTTAGSVYQQLLRVGVDLNRTPLDQLPVIPIETVQQAATLAAGGTARDPFAGANLILMPDDFNNPRAFQWGLGVDREVIRNLVAGVQFNYVNTVHLMRNRDYNLPIPFVQPNDLTQRPTFGLRTLGVRRPLPGLGSITVRETSSRSMYRAITFSAQYRASSLQFGSHYTWNENFSDDDSERDATGFNAENPFNFRNDYGYSRNDIRHQFTGWFLYSLPLGFEVSGSVRARSGLPINPVTGADNNEEFSNNDRPFSAPGVSFERNSFRNRKVISNDLRVLKNFPFGDRMRLQFSAELFNLLNLDNVVFSGTAGSIFTGGIYGNGLNAAGQPAPVDSRFMLLRNADGTYNRQNAQVGSPLQAQFGLRFFF